VVESRTAAACRLNSSAVATTLPLEEWLKEFAVVKQLMLFCYNYYSQRLIESPPNTAYRSVIPDRGRLTVSSKSDNNL
jgi:hypothetical protein